jgi:hypothetical protein
MGPFCGESFAELEILSAFLDHLCVSRVALVLEHTYSDPRDAIREARCLVEIANYSS